MPSENSAEHADTHLAAAPIARPGAATLACVRALCDADALVFRRLDGIDAALAGRGDLDVVVARHRFGQLQSELRRSGGIRGVLRKGHDNRMPGREDWFVLDPLAEGPVHFDLHERISVGPRFCKTVPFVAREDIEPAVERTATCYRLKLADADFPLRLQLAKTAFGARAFVPLGWLELASRHLEGVSDTISVAEEAVRIETGDRRHRVAFAALTRVRRAILRRAGFELDAIVRLWLRHGARAMFYSGSRGLDRLGVFPLPKRRPEHGGLVCALLGTDGVGKSTQVRRLTSFLNRKFDSRRLYLGSSGIVSGIALAARSWRHRKAGGRSRMSPRRRASGLRAHLEDLARSLWGLWLGIYRYGTARRARSLAARGYIVIADRWPQSLERGLLDGPVRRRTEATWRLTERLFGWELALYERLNGLRPDLTIQLIASYEEVERRKPGELSEEAFDRRIRLLGRCREADFAIQAIDAGEPVQQVFARILELVNARLRFDGVRLDERSAQ